MSDEHFFKFGLLVLLLTVEVLSQETGVTIKDKSTTSFETGDYVNLQCDNPSGGELEWVYASPVGEIVLADKPPIVINSAIMDGGKVSYLSIEGIEADDAGTYTCRSVDDPTNIDTVTLTVDAVPDPALGEVDDDPPTTVAELVAAPEPTDAEPADVAVPTVGVTIEDLDYTEFDVDEIVMLTCHFQEGTGSEWVFTSTAGDVRVLSDDEPPIVINSSADTSFLSIEGISGATVGDYSCRSVDDKTNKATISLTLKVVAVAPEAPATTVTLCRGDICGDDDDEETTTQVQLTTQEETTHETPTAPADLPPMVPVVGDACSDFETINGTHFKNEKPNGNGQCFGFNSPSKWIKFTLDNDAAEIPIVPIKQDYCGTHFAFTIHLQDKEMPSMNETISAQICSYLRGEVAQICGSATVVDIHNCNDEFYVYKFTENMRNDELCGSKVGADVCLKAPGEEVPIMYRSDMEETTTSLPLTTTTIDYGLPRMEALTQEQANGTLTIEYKFPENEDESNCTGFWVGIDENFRQMIADALNTYINKPPEPPTTVALTTRVATTAEPAVELTTFVEATTTPVTTTTTPAPTEQEEFFLDVEEVLASDVKDIEGTEEKAEVGVHASDNMDDDADKGPAKRHAQNEGDIPVKVEDTREETEEIEEEETDVAAYTKDDVFYVFDTPVCVKGVIQVAFIVVRNEPESNRTKRDAEGGNVVPQGVLDKAVSAINEDAHQDKTGLEYQQHYQGEPRDPAAETGGRVAPISIWDAHMGLFIAVIVLLIICIIVIIIGILCVNCKGRRSKSTPEKTPLRAEEGHSPTGMENPNTDEEITRGEAQMTEAPHPAYTPNGSGQHLTKGDEDNGWVVPMDELSCAEREKPEVENTKL